MALHARYDPLPDARGPTRGVASPHGRSRTDRVHGAPPLAAREALMKARDEAREFFETKVRPRLGAIPGAAGGARDAPGTSTVATKTSEMSDDDGDRSGRKRRPLRRVVVVGDSLVTGVGCRMDRCDGPTLPRRLGEALADAIGADVEWVAVGAKGADLAAIRRDVIPSLGSRRRRRDDDDERRSSSSSSSSRIDAVVLMCGVNDFKHALTGRQSPAAFHADLIRCVDDIKRALGDDVWVILPGMPMQLATIFPPPLRYLAVHASDAWDAQKRKLCDAAARVRFVPSPSSEAMQSAAGAGVAMVAVDGIHPNDAGYGAWAHHIAKSVAPVLLGDGAALCEEGGEEGGGKEEEDGKEEGASAIGDSGTHGA